MPEIYERKFTNSNNLTEKKKKNLKRYALEILRHNKMNITTESQEIFGFQVHIKFRDYSLTSEQ